MVLPRIHKILARINMVFDSFRLTVLCVAYAR